MVDSTPEDTANSKKRGEEREREQMIVGQFWRVGERKKKVQNMDFERAIRVLLGRYLG